MRRLLPLFSLATLSSPSKGDLRPPYTADVHTLHLFHFESPSGATSTPNSGIATQAAIAVDGDPISNPPTLSTAILGADGYPGFGKAAHISASDLFLGVDGNDNGSYRPDLSGSSLGTDRLNLSSLGILGNQPFTLEALVCPLSSTGNRHIVSTDSSAATRGFQFRLVNGGSTGQRLEFHLIANSRQYFAEIPASGSHAFATGQWYHVAFSFDGSTARFFWTALHSGATEANTLASFAATLDAPSGVAGPLTFGNENRATSGEGFNGLIDQIRLSDTARSAADFVFEAPDLITDEDQDQLPDSWEILHFGHLDSSASDDPDLDGYSNLQEYQAGSHPDQPDSIPGDIDGDSLPDTWEISFFGHLNFSSSSDPDGDGESNAVELANGSAPNHRASNSSDTDADALPDAWELEHFQTLAFNGGADPDQDGFSNLQEYLASTLPSRADSRPPGTAVRLVPLDDGDPATSDFGYAGSSAINTVAFVRSSIQTFGSQQFVTWYGRHQHDSGAAFNNTIWIGRRALGSSSWEIFRHPSFTANNIADGHDVICFGIDGDGYMHLSWGMHGDDFHYSRSTSPVTGSGPVELGPDTAMTGREATVTYPQFLRLPDGDLLYLFREGASGNGDYFLNRYDTATGAWDNVHRNGNTQLPFIKGTGWTPNYNPYPNMPQLGGDGGELILTWCWRYEPVGGDSPGGFDGYQTNNHFAFGRSPDAGLTWQRFDRTPYALPISRNGESGDPDTAAEHIVQIPEGFSLINQAGMCLDRSGHPVIASWWAPETAGGNFRRQYMIVFRAPDGSWQTRPVSQRTSNPAATRYSESAVRDLGRPIVVCDDDDRIIVAYRDDEGANGITVVHSLPAAQDPDRLLWIELDLTTDNLGNFEPIIDNELWDRERQLHFLYQASEGEGYTPPANTADRISVLEWDARRYFSHTPQAGIRWNGEDSVYEISTPSEPSWSYRLWRSDDLLQWHEVEVIPGTGSPLTFRAEASPSTSKRFWKIEQFIASP